MKAVGLIVEYNPFHNGHRYHLRESKRISGADYTVAVMSGHFLQRGEPALLDKWTRAAMAVENGVDLVLELPTYFATASAEQFAYGAVSLLTRLGVASICFGSESGDIASLSRTADLLAAPSEVYQVALRAALDDGLAYHSAVAAALKNSGHGDFSFSANNILGLAYLKAARRLDDAPQLLTIARRGSDYNADQLTGQFSSARAIRNRLRRPTIDWQAIAAAMPAASFERLYNSHFYCHLDDFKALLNGALLRAGRRQLRSIRGAGEGIENRLMANLSNVLRVSDVVDLVATKRHPKTRVQRLLINALLGIVELPTEAIKRDFDYARILAFNAAGRQLIKHFKRQTDLTLFTNLGRDLKKYRRRNALIELDVKATGIYAQVNRSLAIRADYRTAPLEIDK